MTTQRETSSSSLEASQFNMQIETQRLILRPFCDDDVGAIYDIAMQPGFHFLRLHSTERYLPEIGGYPTEQDVWNSSAALVQHCQENMQPGPDGLPKEFKLAICLKAEANKVIGYRSFGPLHDFEGKTRDIGTCIHKDYQCNGLSSEAGKAIIGAFFQVTDQHPQLFAGESLDVNATVHPRNVASQKGLSKMHFVNTGEVTETNVQGVMEPRLCFRLNKDKFLNEEGYAGVVKYAHHQRN